MTIFFFNDTATTEIYTLSLHDALPISSHCTVQLARKAITRMLAITKPITCHMFPKVRPISLRSEEHTSELQSRQYLVCHLLLEKKNIQITTASQTHCILSDSDVCTLTI